MFVALYTIVDVLVLSGGQA